MVELPISLYSIYYDYRLSRNDCNQDPEDIYTMLIRDEFPSATIIWSSVSGYLRFFYVIKFESEEEFVEFQLKYSNDE